MVDQDGWHFPSTQHNRLSFGKDFDQALQHIQLPQPILRVLMVRHGETAYNVQGIIQGQMDTPLNSLGRKQALITGNALATTSLDAIYSSPLQRTMDTASSIHHFHPNKDSIVIQPDDRLKERAFGSLEGQSFKGRKTDTIPGIEKTQKLQGRVADFWNDLVEREASGAPRERHAIKTVLLVGHGAALSALLEVLNYHALLHEGVKASRLWNCSITELAVVLPDLDATDGKSAKEWKVRPTYLLSHETANLPTAERNIVISRWADVRHLEVGSSPQETSSEGSNGKEEQPAVHKDANADELSFEEDEK